MKLYIALFLSLALVGCASVTGSKLQPVSVASMCNGQQINDVMCTLTNDKGQWFIKTPGTVTINKSYEDLTVDCKKDDITGSAKFQSKAEGGAWGNIIAGGGIGYLVDRNTGAGFSYQTNLTVQLIGECKKSEY